jgi:hypothetical protein
MCRVPDVRVRVLVAEGDVELIAHIVENTVRQNGHRGVAGRQV